MSTNALSTCHVLAHLQLKTGASRATLKASRFEGAAADDEPDFLVSPKIRKGEAVAGVFKHEDLGAG
jgi:hypothetical protein